MNLDFYMASYISALMQIPIMIILGLIFGSLGSVILTRFADGVIRNALRGFFFGYSQCPQCKQRLKAKNLVPLASYLAQGGKCSHCGKKISRMYPVLEILCAGIFLLTYFVLKDFGTPTLIFGLIVNRLFILLLVYDLIAYELHMIIWIVLVMVGILANIILPEGNLRHAFLSALLFGGIFTGIYFFAKWYAKMRFKKEMEGFGEGDVYLAIVLGIFLPLILSFHGIQFSGWMMINVLILFVLMSSIIGLVRAGLQYIMGTWDMGHGIRKGISSSSLVPNSMSLNVIPFFPAMIVAFRILAWKAPYFISLLFG